MGSFKSGTYAGKKIYVALLPACEGPCGSGALKLVEGASPGKYVVLKNHSTPLDNFQDDFLDYNKFTVDSSFKIPDLAAPVTLSGTKAGQTLVMAEAGVFQAPYELFNAGNLKFVYNDPKVGPVYTTPDNADFVDSVFKYHGFYVKSPDWNTLVYTIKPSFLEKDRPAQITWNGNVKNTSQYIYQDITGCGTSAYANVVNSSQVSLEKDLVKTGITNGGDPVYELKDKNHSILKDIYENKYHPYDGSKKSYEEFLGKHPVFFWVDPWGRLIRFENFEFQPAAECGKPVIYLYPEKTTVVSVQVDPVGGFTYTEPAYNSGWKILARPNGELTNLSDGLKYPYLFWKGYGSLYQTPEKGFVVAREDVHKFFAEKLDELGLNQKESADFMEFWQPYFTDAPYYFVTFMDNSVMDKIAPLTVKPKPDTVIRILMDFKPLQKPIEVQGYNIKTPIRRGFTVVEWGGVKH